MGQVNQKPVIYNYLMCDMPAYNALGQISLFTFYGFYGINILN